MYTRQITEPPRKLICNKKPVFGTYIGLPTRLDINGIKTPFGVIPLPPFITNFAIRSRLSFTFSAGDYIGQAVFFDSKIFGYGELVLFNTKLNVKTAYKTFTGPRKRLIPKNLKKGACISFKKNRYFKISWDRINGRFSVLFNMKGDSLRPNATAAFLGKSKNAADIITVMPAPTARRCSATWTCSFPIHGFLSVNKSNMSQIMDNIDGSALITINRSYYKLHANSTSVTGTGLYEDQKLQFNLIVTSLDATDTNKCNPNVLFFDSNITPLPQVFITHPFGINKTWVIQDTENMVDLSFTPITESVRNINVIFFRTVYHIMYGVFEGTIVTQDGKSLALKNFPGIAQSALLRL